MLQAITFGCVEKKKNTKVKEAYLASVDESGRELELETRGSHRRSVLGGQICATQP